MSEKRKVEEVLAELGKKIDDLVEEAKEAGNRVSDETEKRIEELKERKEKLEADFKEYSSGTHEKWESAKEHLNEATNALRKAIEAFFK